MEFTKNEVLKRAASFSEVWSKGANTIERAYYFILLGDWISVLLAEKKNIDAVEVNVITNLKNQLTNNSRKEKRGDDISQLPYNLSCQPYLCWICIIHSQPRTMDLWARFRKQVAQSSPNWGQSGGLLIVVIVTVAVAMAKDLNHNTTINHESCHWTFYYCFTIVINHSCGRLWIRLLDK